MKIKYVGCLHRGFYRFDVSETDIKDYIDGYVDVEVDKKTERFSIHGTEHGSGARVVNELNKLFNDKREQVIREMNA